MDVRILLIAFLVGALNLNQKTLPSAQRQVRHPKDIKPLVKPSPFTRAPVKDFSRKKFIDIVARNYLANDIDSILPENSNNDTLKAKTDFTAALLNGSSDISGNTDFDIQERVKELNKMISIIEEVKDGLRKKQQLMGQRVNSKITTGYTTHFYRDFDKNPTVYPTSLGLNDLVSQEKTSDIQEDFDSEVSNDFEQDVDTHITFQSDDENLNLFSEGPQISESQTAIISAGKTPEYILLSTYVPNPTLVYGPINKFINDDIQSTKKFHEMISENKETKGITEIDSVGDTTEKILSSKNIAISPLVFGNNNKGEHIDQVSSQTVITTGDKELPTELRHESYEVYNQVSETRSEETLMDSMKETYLSSLNDRKEKSEFTEPSTSAAVPPILMSTYPTFYKILLERGRSVAPQKSVINNYQIKGTSKLRKEWTLLSTKYRDRLFSDFSTKEKTTTTSPYKSKKSQSDVMLKNVHDSISSVSEPKYLNNAQATNPVVYEKISGIFYSDYRGSRNALLERNTVYSGGEFPSNIDITEPGTSTKVSMIKSASAHKFKAPDIESDKLSNFENKEIESYNAYTTSTVSFIVSLPVYFSNFKYDAGLSEGNDNNNKFDKHEYITHLKVTTKHSSELDDSDMQRSSLEILPTVYVTLLKTTNEGDFENNTEPGTESTMIGNVFSRAETALHVLKNSFLCIKNFFIKNLNPDGAHANVENSTDLLVHEDKTNSSHKNFGFTTRRKPRKLTNFSDY